MVRFANWIINLNWCVKKLKIFLNYDLHSQEVDYHFGFLNCQKFFKTCKHTLNGIFIQFQCASCGLQKWMPDDKMAKLDNAKTWPTIIRLLFVDSKERKRKWTNLNFNLSDEFKTGILFCSFVQKTGNSFFLFLKFDQV